MVTASKYFINKLWLSTRTMNDQATGRPKGFGFVSFNTKEEANTAIEAMDGNVFFLLWLHLFMKRM